MSDEYYLALHKCGERYRDMLAPSLELAKTIRAENEQRIDILNSLDKFEALWAFNLEFMFGCRDKLPLMKLNRWLGYIQGCLIERGYTTVEIERDWTRPLFKHLDYA